MNENDNTEFDDDLMARAAALATDVAPVRDLWPAIEQAITVPAKPARTVWNSVWAQAAAVFLLVGGSSGVTYLAVGEQSATTPPVGGLPVQGLQFQPVSGSFGSLYHLGPDYQDAQRGLAVKFDEQLELLAPEEREIVEKNIEVIRTAIDDINAALANQPDNELLQKLLINTYQEELDLMMQVDGITSAAMRRGDI